LCGAPSSEKAEERVTLAEAAVCAGCSERALQLAFRRCRGMTSMAVLRRIRLEAARAALAGSHRPPPIREIAAVYRFSNPSRFARLFRETFGQLPSRSGEFKTTLIGKARAIRQRVVDREVASSARGNG
jgi:AraC-like DNA-binding protein